MKQILITTEPLFAFKTIVQNTSLVTLFTANGNTSLSHWGELEGLKLTQSFIPSLERSSISHSSPFATQRQSKILDLDGFAVVMLANGQGLFKITEYLCLIVFVGDIRSPSLC